jgi:hypothetical protein
VNHSQIERNKEKKKEEKRGKYKEGKRERNVENEKRKP